MISCSSQFRQAIKFLIMNTLPISSHISLTTTRHNLKSHSGNLLVGLIRHSSFVEGITNLIEANIDNADYGICQLCKDAGTSRSQLHRKLIKYTNLSTSHFIRAIRLKKARALLLCTDLNITQIAYEVGFREVTYFSRLFSKAYGQAPRVFRKCVVRKA